VTVPVRPPRREGLHTLAPELARIVEALARVQAEKDSQTQGMGVTPMPSPTEPNDTRRPLRPL
jgi:hypothetical protein